MRECREDKLAAEKHRQAADKGKEDMEAMHV
jgi:hypothetical protein